MKLLFFKLLFFFPIIFIVLVINFVVDPANLYRGKKYEQEIANFIASGKNIANVNDYNEMLLQKSYIEILDAPMDVIVVGSSKVLQIDSSYFPNQTFFNNGITGATVDDFMVIYYMYRKMGLLPKRIIVGIDASLLNKKSGNIQYASVPSEYLEMAKSFNILLTFSDKVSLKFKGYDRFVQLLSPSYFQSSIEQILGNNPKRDYFLTDKVYLDVNVKSFDGSLTINKKVRERTRDEINHQAELYSVEENDHIDNLQKIKFEKFIQILKEDNVEIVFLIIPYQIKAYDSLINGLHLSILNKSKSYFEKIAQNNNIKLIGSYNPADYNLSEDDFYDGVHIKSKALKKIMYN